MTGTDPVDPRVILRHDDELLARRGRLTRGPSEPEIQVAPVVELTWAGQELAALAAD
jgi:hypothetical protein